MGGAYALVAVLGREKVAASLEPMEFLVGRGGGGSIAVDGRLKRSFELEKCLLGERRVR